MSSFNNIEKIQYTSGSEKELVSLIEYIVFSDEKSNDKYLVFKLKNNLSQNLYDLAFRITEYDKDGNPIVSSKVYYSRVIIHGNETFVPNMKFKAQPDCASVSYELCYAQFEEITFRDGVETKNTISLKDYYNEKKNGEPNKPVSKVKVTKQNKKLNRKLKKSKFLVKEIINKNKSKALIVLSSLLVIGLAIGAGVSTSMFLSNNDVFEINNYYCRFVNSETQDMQIVGYSGHDKELVIPAQIRQRNIVSISNKAFKNNDNITSVYFESKNLVIEPDSFMDCDNLTSITGYGNIVVYNSAFADCDNLAKVHLPNSDIKTLSFSKSLNINTFIFGTSYSMTFGRIFGIDNKDVKIKYISTSMNANLIDPIFFEGVQSEIQYR